MEASSDGEAVPLCCQAIASRERQRLSPSLVRPGADYFSDEYAVFDEEGLVHSFPRKLSIRTNEPVPDEEQIAVESIGGRVATSPATVKCVLFTNFDDSLDWEPQILTLGQGMMRDFAANYCNQTKYGICNKYIEKSHW